MFGIIAQPDSAERAKKLKGLFDDMLDYADLARASLGNKWHKLDADQKVEFSDLLEQLVRKNYQRNLKKMLGWNVQYYSETVLDGGVVEVKSRAVHKTDSRQDPLLLDFKVKERDGKWLVIDLSPEGASLVATYRSQFTRILDKDGYPALKAKMQKKLAEKLE